MCAQQRVPTLPCPGSEPRNTSERRAHVTSCTRTQDLTPCQPELRSGHEMYVNMPRRERGARLSDPCSRISVAPCRQFPLGHHTLKTLTNFQRPRVPLLGAAGACQDRRHPPAIGRRDVVALTGACVKRAWRVPRRRAPKVSVESVAPGAAIHRRQCGISQCGVSP